MRSLLILLFLIATSQAAAHSRIDTIELALAGDLEALDRYLEDSHDDLPAASVASGWDWLIRGFALRAAGRMNDAVEVWEQAAAEGERIAVRVLAWHHVDQERWIDAYGWSQLAMEVTALEQDLNRNQLGGQWARYNAVLAAEGLDPSDYEAAEAYTGSLIETYGPSLAADPSRENQERYPGFEPVKRTAPSYPASLARRGTPGWAYTVFEVDEEGRVGRAVSLAATDPDFARAARRAIRNWRFETGDVEEFPIVSRQLIDFSLDR